MYVPARGGLAKDHKKYGFFFRHPSLICMNNKSLSAIQNVRKNQKITESSVGMRNDEYSDSIHQNISLLPAPLLLSQTNKFMKFVHMRQKTS